MIDTKDIIRMARHVTKRSSGIPDRRIMHPTRDWFIGLGMATLMFFVGVAYAGYEFFTYLRQTDATIPVETTVVRYNQERVQSVLSVYGERETRFDVVWGSVRDEIVTEAVREEPATSTATTTEAALEEVEA